ncbi:hypothetical protein DERP_003714 [Dermatophagoides pteronyssinus]|uniref:Uncharacterized protein n=1 Tax=Dermatophagoides pteronyssinus TaxID=6956 RepID=A0ABQ8JLX5_DERPT|nr:hypothetical protein DERP_003714 [Dermatophagoides pteronyssinus]
MVWSIRILMIMTISGFLATILIVWCSGWVIVVLQYVRGQPWLSNYLINIGSSVVELQNSI